MSDKGKVEKNEQKFFTLYDNLNNQLKASNFYYSNGDKYYREYSDFISNLSHTYEGLKTYGQQNLTALKQREEQARNNAHNDQVFAANAEEAIRVKTDELTEQNRLFEQTRPQLATELQGLDAKKLTKLKVKEQTQLQNFFGTFHRVFYSDAADAFDWARFKTAFEKDKLKDMRERLGNPKFSSLTNEHIGALERIRDDPFYADLAKNPKEGSGIAPLVNYLRVFVDAARAHERVAILQTEIAQIKIDAPRRAETARTEAVLAEDLRRNIQYLEELNARLVRSAEPFADESQRARRGVEDYEQHKSEIRNSLEEYRNVQHIPRHVYTTV